MTRILDNLLRLFAFGLLLIAALGAFGWIDGVNVAGVALLGFLCWLASEIAP